MANEKRLIDAKSLWLIFAEKAEKIELGVKDERKRVVSKLLIHWCMDELAGAPTVDAVEVVHGRWLGERGGYTCSVCGSEGPEDGGYWASPFCPCCGAKMDGERKDNG